MSNRITALLAPIRQFLNDHDGEWEDSDGLRLIADAHAALTTVEALLAASPDALAAARRAGIEAAAQLALDTVGDWDEARRLSTAILAIIAPAAVPSPWQPDDDATMRRPHEVAEGPDPGSWTVDAIGAHGAVYVATFTGHRARARAFEYAEWKKHSPPYPSNPLPAPPARPDARPTQGEG